MDNSTLSTKLENGEAEVTVDKGVVKLVETVTSTFQKDELQQNITNLTNKIEETEKAIDQTKINITNLESQVEVLKASRDNFRELLKQTEEATS